MASPIHAQLEVDTSKWENDGHAKMQQEDRLHPLEEKDRFKFIALLGKAL